MKFVKYLFIAATAVLILWINIPRAIPVKFTIFSQNINFTIPTANINFFVGTTRFQKEFKTQLGLDLKGGSHLVFEADISKVKPEDLEDALQSSRDVVERRVNLFGVSEPSIRTIKSGNIYRISVDLPGVENVDEAVQLIGQTAQLQFKLRNEKLTPAEATTTPLFLQFNKNTGLTGKDVKKASVQFDPQSGAPQVLIAFNSNGAKIFGDLTKKNVGKPIGIFLDEFILSAPVVQQAIVDGNAVISGNFTTDIAKQLAIAINSGALPVPIKMVEQRNIGPTLGAEEVQKSITAGFVGLAMVMLFMLVYYGRLGLAACFGLVIYGAITFAIFRAVPIVLTLPGIAGFLLSIGMAVDSNILIFERIKEEIRKGKPFDTAVRQGFGRAIDAIKDANITTLLVAFILFNPLNWEFLPQFGLVRGFALTLAIGVGISLFTGLVITRHLIKFFYKEE